jgi:hypothetical protein
MAKHAGEFQATQRAPLPQMEAELPVITSDCKGVPMRQVDGEEKPKKKRLGKGEKNGTKRMACVGGIYTIDRWFASWTGKQSSGRSNARCFPKRSVSWTCFT